MAPSPERVEIFFRFAFGGVSQGYICIAWRDRKTKKFTEKFVEHGNWKQIYELIEEHYTRADMWYCPHVFGKQQRNKQYVLATPSAWSDLDECEPENLLLTPNITVESSPGRYQALWLFAEQVDPFQAEQFSKRIAYFHSEDGADKSGWDLTQLLRIPYTFNFKRSQDAPDQVVIVGTKPDHLYTAAEFSVYPPISDEALLSIPLPDDVDKLNPHDILNKRRNVITPIAWHYIDHEPKNDWSSALWALENALIESGLSREEVFVIAREAKCNKYERDGRSDMLLWREVCRAFSQAEKTVVPRLSTTGPDADELLTDEERVTVFNNPGLVEEYIEWASTLGDAAAQYHIAGAFTILSAILAGNVKLPTSFGTVTPNLWFMILASTTLTRKTTSMDIAMDLLSEVEDDAILATDGSIEGLFAGLAARPNKPSIFLRDEFSGLLEAIAKKDYMAGMAEMLTKLYDGKYQKRILRKEVIEVRDPILIMLAGGIKGRIYELLNFDAVASGFLPRFLFITAEADISRLRPVGPPTMTTSNARNVLIAKLRNLYQHYHQFQELVINGKKIVRDKRWEATMTDEAWARYNKLEAQLLSMAQESDAPEIMTPTFDRLAKSTLKAALLIAAARQRTDEVVVSVDDICHAIFYAQQWVKYATEVMSNVGLTAFEKQVNAIVADVAREPGMARGTVMRKYRLNARDADQVLTTMEQRGMIRSVKEGKAVRIYAND